MTKKTDTTFLDQKRGVIHSRKGGWIMGKAVFNHGYSMMDDLIGKVTFTQLMVMNATGRLPSKRLGKWFEASLFCTSWPDHRIWCNQIGALGGTSRTPAMSATIAGTLAADSRAYGVPPVVESIKFIQKALRKKREGVKTKKIIADELGRQIGSSYIIGYSRPLATGDVRVPAMERIRKKLGFAAGAHLKLAFKISRHLHKSVNEQINAGGYLAAFLADQGFSATEVERIYATMVYSGVVACYADTSERPAGTFLPLRCSDVHYKGKPARSVPDPA